MASHDDKRNKYLERLQTGAVGYAGGAAVAGGTSVAATLGNLYADHKFSQSSPRWSELGSAERKKSVETFHKIRKAMNISGADLDTVESIIGAHALPYSQKGVAEHIPLDKRTYAGIARTTPHPEVMAHELGHLKDFSSNQFLRNARLSLYGHAPVLGALGSIGTGILGAARGSSKEPDNAKKKAGTAAAITAASAPGLNMLQAELAADRHAIKALKTIGHGSTLSYVKKHAPLKFGYTVNAATPLLAYLAGKRLGKALKERREHRSHFESR